MNENLIKNVNNIMREEQEAGQLPKEPASFRPAAPPDTSEKAAEGFPAHPAEASGEEPKVKRKGGPPFALFMVLALFALSALLIYQLLRLNMLPGFYLLGLGVFLLALLLLIAALSWDLRKKFRSFLGIFLGLLLAAVCIVGSLYTDKAIGTIRQIVHPQTTEMGLYVRREDPAGSLAELKGEVIGRLSSLNREESDAFLSRIEGLWQEKPTAVRYSRPAEMLEALLSGQIRTAMLSRNLVEALAHNQSDFSADQLRLIDLYEAPAPQKAETPSYDQPFILYISGIDDRESLADFARSDVNILAVINPATRQVLLVNTPRDYYITTPVSGDAPDKLTHAGTYGVDVSRQTLSDLYEVPVDYTFRLDFGGFKNIIDALGGVDVYSDQTFQVENYTFEEGMNHLSGYQALLFARHRYGLEGGDRARGVHQMAVINAVLKKIASPELLKQFFPLMDALSGSFKTTVPYDTLTGLVQHQLQEGGGWNVVNYSVNGSDSMDYPYSWPVYTYVMLPDWDTVEQAKQMIRQVLSGEPLQEQK